MRSSSGAGSVFFVAARARSSSSDPNSPPVGRCRVSDFSFCIVCWADCTVRLQLLDLVGWPGGLSDEPRVSRQQLLKMQDRCCLIPGPRLLSEAVAGPRQSLPEHCSAP